MSAAPTLAALDAGSARRWAVLTRSVLASHRAELDALNVFPVPDGDTGTNLYLTFDTALEAAWAGVPSDASLAELTESLAKAMLLSARGNSGVILSQILRGLADEVAGRAVSDLAGSGHEPCVDLDGPALARALRRASDLAWRSVFRPREGTILSVAEAAAVAAEAAAANTTGVTQVARTAMAAAREALARTPEQLVELARAGVVDAGGAGFVLLLEALVRIVAGDPISAPTVPVAGPDPAQPIGPAGLIAGPAYEVMYLLDGADSAGARQLRERLDALGDSVVVVGDGDLWTVHAHVDDVGAAIEAGIEVGRPHRIDVTRFADQIATVGPAASCHVATAHQSTPSVAPTVAVVVAVGGAGLVALFREAGAIVVPSRPRRRASVAALLDACRPFEGRGVVLMPLDPDLELAARAAASAGAEDGLDIRVVALSSPVEGLAALAVHDPESDLDAAVEALSEAAAATAYGAVTIASREPHDEGEPWRRGDVLGLVGGDIAAVGSDLVDVGVAVARALVSGREGAEILTVITGSDAPAGLGADLAAALSASGRVDALDVIHLEGGQPVYHLLLGVE